MRQNDSVIAEEGRSSHTGGRGLLLNPTFSIFFWILTATTVWTVLDAATLIAQHTMSSHDERADNDASIVVRHDHTRTADTLKTLLTTAEESVEATKSTILDKLHSLETLLLQVKLDADTISDALEEQRKHQHDTVSAEARAREAKTAAQTQDDERTRAGLLQYFGTLRTVEKLLTASLAVEKGISTQELLAWRSRVLGPLVLMDKSLLGGHEERYQKLKDIEAATVEVLTRWAEHFREPGGGAMFNSAMEELSMEVAHRMREPVYHPIFAPSAEGPKYEEEGRRLHEQYNAA